MRRWGWILATLVLAAGLGVVAWLTYGAEVQERVLDKTSDIGVVNGYKPAERRVADIITASVRARGDLLIFDATMAVPIPPEVPEGFFDLNWRIHGDTRWVLTGSITIRPEASLIDETTSTGSSTATGGFPGTIESRGKTLRIVLRPNEVQGFPQRFRWALFSRLDLRPGRKGVGLVTDNAPEGRFANFRL